MSKTERPSLSRVERRPPCCGKNTNITIHCAIKKLLFKPPPKDIPWPVILDSESVRRKRYDVEQSSRILYLSPSGQNSLSPTATPKGPFSPLKLPYEEWCDQSDLAKWLHCGSARTGTDAADLRSHGLLLPQRLQRARVSGIWWCIEVQPDSSWPSLNSYSETSFLLCDNVCVAVQNKNTHKRKKKTIGKLLFKENICANKDRFRVLELCLCWGSTAP